MANKIKGGKADKMSIEDIARKHSQFVGTIQKELDLGIKIEKEHTTDPKVAREIALDHLTEFPDYYTRLDSMEKKAKKSKEPKEQTMAGSSGSYESGLSMPIMKRDIQNFKLKSKQKEFDESTTASVSAGAMYDAPIGHKQKDPLAIDNPTMKKVEEEGPILGNKKLDSNTNLGLPMWVKGGEYVGINKTPTNKVGRNSGDPKNFTTYKNKSINEAIKAAAKKYGITTKQVEEILIIEAKKLTQKK